MCETCDVRARYHDLWAVNREAWRVCRILQSRAVQEYQLGSLVLQALTEQQSAPAIVDLIRRISLIQEILDPADGHQTTRH